VGKGWTPKRQAEAVGGRGSPILRVPPAWNVRSGPLKTEFTANASSLSQAERPHKPGGVLLFGEDSNRIVEHLEFGQESLKVPVAEGWFVPSFCLELNESGWSDYQF